MGRGRGKAGPKHGASEGGTQKPRAAASGREEGREADGRRLGNASRLLGQVPFPLLPSWAAGETWLPGTADRVAQDRQVWPGESAHG